MRAWGAYAARAVVAVGHEQALANYSNAQKAALRDAWTSQFDLSLDDSRRTVLMVGSIAPRLHAATQKLYLGAQSLGCAESATRGRL